MLSRKTELSLGYAVTLMFISGSGPISWNWHGGFCKFVTNRKHFIFCICNFVIMVAYEGFVTFRTLQALLPPDGEDINLPMTCHLLYTLSCYGVPIHLQITTFCRWHEIPSFINAYVQFFKYFKAHYVIQERPNGCEKLIRVFFTLAGLITLQNCVLIMKRPERPFFLTSLMTNPKSKSVLRLFLTIIHLHIWLSFWAQLLFYGTLLYTFAFPGLSIIREMTAKQNLASINRLTSNKLRNPHTFMKMFRCMQVLQGIFNFICRSIFFPGHKVVMSLSVIFSIYGAIKLHSNRAILMGFVACTGLLYLSILFRRMGKFFDLSVDLLDSWKGGSKILTKYIKSCHPIVVDVGGYYFVRKSTVVALISVIINSAINMLLTF